MIYQTNRIVSLYYPYPTISSSCLLHLGADKFVYAPEPIDVGRVLQVDILANGQKISATATGPVEPGRSYFMKHRLFIKKTSDNSDS